MMQKGGAGIEDILLLFIYLELGAMVGIYFKTNRLPVRFLIYIAITALTRLLIDMISANHTAEIEILYVPIAILLLTVAVLVIRYTSHKNRTSLGVSASKTDFHAMKLQTVINHRQYH